MIIPHDQERTISLQLNWAIMGFLIGILTLAGILSIFGIYHKQKRQEELHNLEMLYGTNFKATVELERQISTNSESYEQLSRSLFQIAEFLSMPREEIIQPSNYEDTEKNARQILLGESNWDWHSNLEPRIDYLPPVYALKGLHILLADQEFLLQTIDNYLNGGLKIYNAMPIGRPFKNFSRLHDTSGYGPRINPVERGGIELHKGYDTAGPYDTPIYATGNGVVHKVYRWTSGYGRAVVIKHDYGFYSMFAHLSRAFVRPGTPVKRGELIASMGNSGRVTGPHLHYEIWQGEQVRIDPKPMICAIDLITPACARYNRQLDDLFE